MYCARLYGYNAFVAGAQFTIWNVKYPIRNNKKMLGRRFNP